MKQEKITSEEYYKAAGRWGHYWKDTKKFMTFHAFLGIPEFGVRGYDLVLPEDAARKIRLLNSQHWRTLLNARCINAGIKPPKTSNPI